MKLKGELFEDWVPPPPKPRKRGHAGIPGNGPDGETCKTCKHLVRKLMAKTYMKCALTEAKWTGGAGSDVRVRDPACDFWEAKKV